MCCGVLSETDEDGIRTDYAYDSALRPSLAPGLIAVAARNINQGMESLRFFECGRVFRNTGGGKGKDIENEVPGIFMAGKPARIEKACI